ncbi:MAG: recombinase RecA, partial [Anaerolineae bacterium]
MGVEMGIVDKRGSFYSFDETRLGQGRANVKELLRENPEIALEIENLIREQAGLSGRGVVVAEDEEEIITPISGEEEGEEEP